MGGRHFEWAAVWNAFDKTAMARALARPQSWNLMRGPFEEALEEWAGAQPAPPAPAEEDDDEIGDFQLQLSDECYLHCRLEKELPDQGWSCLFREVDPTLPQWLDLPPYEFEEIRRIVVREVPPTLFVTCSVTPAEPGRCQAIFTTLGGDVVIESYVKARDAATPELCLIPATAAAQQGRLQSRNQKVCVMLEGRVEPLGARAPPKSAWL